MKSRRPGPGGREGGPAGHDSESSAGAELRGGGAPGGGQGAGRSSESCWWYTEGFKRDSGSDNRRLSKRVSNPGANRFVFKLDLRFQLEVAKTLKVVPDPTPGESDLYPPAGPGTRVT